MKINDYLLLLQDANKLLSYHFLNNITFTVLLFLFRW